MAKERSVIAQRGRIWFASACAIGLLALLAAVVLGKADRLDAEVNAFFDPYRAPWLIDVATWVSIFGTEATAIGMATAATAALWSSGRIDAIRRVWWTFAGAEATTWLLKYLIDRPRPPLWPGVAPEVSSSFPSSHAATSASVIGIIAIVAVTGQSIGARRVAFAIGAGMVFLISVSRLVLSLHYLSDVFAGLEIGAFWLALGSRQRAGAR